MVWLALLVAVAACVTAIFLLNPLMGFLLGLILIPVFWLLAAVAKRLFKDRVRN